MAFSRHGQYRTIGLASQAVQNSEAVLHAQITTETSGSFKVMGDSREQTACPPHEEHSAAATAAAEACAAAASPLLDTAVNLLSSDTSTEITVDPVAHSLVSAEIELLLSVSDTPSRRNTRGMSAAAANHATLLHSPGPMHSPAAGDHQSPAQKQQHLNQSANTNTHLNVNRVGSTSSSPPSPHLVALALLAASAKRFEEDSNMMLDMNEEEQEGAPFVGERNRRRGEQEEHTHTPHPKRVRVSASLRGSHVCRGRTVCYLDVAQCSMLDYLRGDTLPETKQGADSSTAPAIAPTSSVTNSHAKIVAEKMELHPCRLYSSLAAC